MRCFNNCFHFTKKKKSKKVLKKAYEILPARYRAAVPQQATTAATHLRVILVGAAVNKIQFFFF